MAARGWLRGASRLGDAVGVSRDDDDRARASSPVERRDPSPADRVKQIEAMMRAQAAAAAPPPAAGGVVPPDPAALQVGPGTPAAARAAGFKLADAFKIAEAALPLPPISAPAAFRADQHGYASRQVSARELFGGSNPELLLVGNPWKIINFGDPNAAAALFDLDGPPTDHQLVVPESAVSTPLGLLFEVGVAPRGLAPAAAAEALTQKRAVLLDAQGRVTGAECRSARDAERLLAGTRWNLPGAAREPEAKWSVEVAPGGAAYPYQLTVARPGQAAQRLAVNNLGQLVDPARGRPALVDLTGYWRDGFEAARLPLVRLK